MVKKSIDVKVRPLSNPSLDKASLLGAARIYISKDSLIALTGALDNGRFCIIEKLDVGADGQPIKREAALWAMPDKNLSPNVVVLTRAFQEATGIKIGDQIRITLGESTTTPDLDEVLAQDVSEDPNDEKAKRDVVYWAHSLGGCLDRAELIFPGMVFEGVSINRARRSYKIISVNGRDDSLARFKDHSSRVLIQGQEASLITLSSSANGVATIAPEGGNLIVTDVPGMAIQVEKINDFLEDLCQPFQYPGQLVSCGLVIHGGPGTGKTFILERIAATNWGCVHRIQPSDKLATVKEVFSLATSQQPSIVLLDDIEKLIATDRNNRDAVIEAINKELDSLSEVSKALNALPKVVVVASCSDWMTDLPRSMRNTTRFSDNVALPIPRASERLEILRSFDLPIEVDEKEASLTEIAGKTHAYSPRDLFQLKIAAGKSLNKRLRAKRRSSGAAKEDGPAVNGTNGDISERKLLAKEDLIHALSVTRPTAMHDINLQPPTIHWKDVGGQENLKKVLSRMIRHNKDGSPRNRRVLRNPPKGLLLYGPPGCSKTLSAQAMATESGFNFFAVKGAELLNMYVGESERAVRNLFERARQAAPSIIFFDEIDSIGGQRGGSGSKSSGAVNTVTTLLTEMDGFETLTGVLILAATNCPEAIDPALLRPGRFDDCVYVGPPDLAAREGVFNVHLRGLSVAADVDVPKLAQLSDGFSGAEISAIVTRAGLEVQERHDDAIDTGDTEAAEKEMEICMADLEGVMEKTSRTIDPFMLMGFQNWAQKFRKK